MKKYCFICPKILITIKSFPEDFIEKEIIYTSSDNDHFATILYCECEKNNYKEYYCGTSKKAIEEYHNYLNTGILNNYNKLITDKHHNFEFFLYKNIVLRRVEEVTILTPHIYPLNSLGIEKICYTIDYKNWDKVENIITIPDSYLFKEAQYILTPSLYLHYFYPYTLKKTIEF